MASSHIAILVISFVSISGWIFLLLKLKLLTSSFQQEIELIEELKIELQKLKVELEHSKSCSICHIE